MERKRPTGRPRDYWGQAMYAQLIGIYEYAFGRPASANNIEGPDRPFFAPVPERGEWSVAGREIQQSGGCGSCPCSMVNSEAGCPEKEDHSRSTLGARRARKKAWCFAWHNIFLEDQGKRLPSEGVRNHQKSGFFRRYGRRPSYYLDSSRRHLPDTRKGELSCVKILVQPRCAVEEHSPASSPASPE